jgi:hypothetical protein
MFDRCRTSTAQPWNLAQVRDGRDGSHRRTGLHHQSRRVRRAIVTSVWRARRNSHGARNSRSARHCPIRFRSVRWSAVTLLQTGSDLRGPPCRVPPPGRYPSAACCVAYRFPVGRRSSSLQLSDGSPSEGPQERHEHGRDHHEPQQQWQAEFPVVGEAVTARAHNHHVAGCGNRRQEGGRGGHVHRHQQRPR